MAAKADVKPNQTASGKQFSLLGTKVGMTRVYIEDGTIVPVTVVHVAPNIITQVKTGETDGYEAVQIGTGEVAPRNTTIPQMAHDHKAGTGPKRFHGEFRVDDASGFELGQEIGLDNLEGVVFVDVTGQSKGKGFQGGVKRHGFKGQLASHGVERKHRSPGSIGGHANNAGKAGRIKKGKKMSGHMGDERVTIRSLEVVRVDNEKNLVLIKGPVPGANKSLVEIRPSRRLYRGKAAKQAEAG